MDATAILVGVVFMLLAAVGFGLVTAAPSPREFFFARLCFVLAAVDVGGVSIYWLAWRPDDLAAWSVVCLAGIGICTGPALTGVLSWVKRREDRSIEADKIPSDLGALREQNAAALEAARRMGADVANLGVEARVCADEIERLMKKCLNRPGIPGGSNV